MKKLFVIAAVMAALSSCLSVSVNGKDWRIGGVSKPIEAGDMTEQVREIRTGYSGLVAHSDVKVVVSPEVREGTVVVRAGSNIIDMVATQQQGDKLDMRFAHNSTVSVRGDATITVLVPVRRYQYLFAENDAAITLPEGYDARGHVEIHALNDAEIHLPRGFKAYALQIRATNDGKVRGYAEVENGVSAVATNDAIVELRGACTRPFEANASNDGKIECAEFVCEVARCTASNDAIVRIHATESISASASNDSVIFYTGTGKLTHRNTANDAEIRWF